MRYTVIDNYDKANKLEFKSFEKMLDYFEPNKEELSELHEEWEQVKDAFDLHDFLRNAEDDERFEIVEVPEDVDILMLDGCARAEAEKFIKAGTAIYTDEKEIVEVAKEVSDDEIITIDNIKNGNVTDISHVRYNDNDYYIVYVN